MTWPLARVGDLAEQIRGVTFAKGDTSPVPGTGLLPVMTATNVTELGLVDESVLYLPRSRVGDNQVLRKNDVLVTASSGSLRVVGRAVLVREETDATFGAFCKVLRPRDGVDPHYFAHFFRTSDYRSRVSRVAAGANINNLRNEDLDDFEIPLPPLPEQRRIASVLDSVDNLRAQRRRANRETELVARELFQHVFGDPIANPNGLPKAPLGKVTTKIGSGATPRGGRESYGAGIVNLIRSMNVRDNRFELHGLASIDAEQARMLDSVDVHEDDVLLNITGASVARVTRAPASVLPARVNQHVAIIRPSSELDPVFLERQLTTPTMKRELLAVAEAGATRQAITKSVIQDLPITLPPLVDQQRFAVVVRAVDALAKQQTEALAKLDELFASLQYRAFRGEL